MAEEKKEGLQFPIRGHDKCPHCGCAERIGQTTIADLKKEGVLEEHMFPKGPAWALPLIDQTKPLMVSPLSITKPKIPILQVFWDVCANPECLGIFVTGVEFITQEINLPKAPAGMLSGGMKQMPPGFPERLGFPFNQG